jgi:hypothetical protein
MNYEYGEQKHAEDHWEGLRARVEQVMRPRCGGAPHTHGNPPLDSFKFMSPSEYRRPIRRPPLLPCIDPLLTSSPSIAGPPYRQWLPSPFVVAPHIRCGLAEEAMRNMHSSTRPTGTRQRRHVREAMEARAFIGRIGGTYELTCWERLFPTYCGTQCVSPVRSN